MESTFPIRFRKKGFSSKLNSVELPCSEVVLHAVQINMLANIMMNKKEFRLNFLFVRYEFLREGW